MIKIAIGLLSSLSLVLLVSCATIPNNDAAVRADLAPTGTLRAGINYGNPILAQRDAATNELTGISVDLSRALAKQIGVPVTLVPFDAAGKMAAALKTSAWDVAFLAVDPAREEEITFSPPYLEIEGTYLVPGDSPIHSVADVDRDGVRIAAGNNSAYDLFLSRNLMHAKIVRAPTPVEAVELFRTDKLEAVAGVRQALTVSSASIPKSRVLDDRFMVIAQAAGVPKGRDVGAHFLYDFIERAKASGLVADSLRRNGVTASVSPSAPDH